MTNGFVKTVKTKKRGGQGRKKMNTLKDKRRNGNSKRDVYEQE